MLKNRLRDIRFEMKMDQNDFCDLLGVGQSLYNKWEKNRSQPNVESLLKLAKVLNRPVEDIIYIDE